MRQNSKDPYYKAAKRDNYRSRSSFKLIQIHQRFELLRKGQVVVDLGSAPGGWLQVAKEFVEEEGLVIGVDLASILPIDGVTIIRGDFTTQRVRDRIMETLADNGKKKVDIVLSDLSPNLTGKYAMDQARSVDLAETALRFALDVLSPNGAFAVKVFQGDMYQDYLKLFRNSFGSSKPFSPKASRSHSSEIYLVGKNPIPISRRVGKMFQSDPEQKLYSPGYIH